MGGVYHDMESGKSGLQMWIVEIGEEWGGGTRVTKL